jgi:hypothetical protein
MQQTCGPNGRHRPKRSRDRPVVGGGAWTVLRAASALLCAHDVRSEPSATTGRSRPQRSRRSPRRLSRVNVLQRSLGERKTMPGKRKILFSAVLLASVESSPSKAVLVGEAVARVSSGDLGGRDCIPTGSQRHTGQLRDAGGRWREGVARVVSWNHAAGVGGARGRASPASVVATVAGSVSTARTVSFPPQRRQTRRSTSNVRLRRERQSRREVDA